MNKKGVFSVALAVSLLTLLTNADANSTFSTGSGYFTTLGLEANYPSDYDHLTVTGKTGSINGSGQYDIASLLFTAGYNAWNIHTDTGTVSLNFSIDGTQGLLTLPYTINVSYQDTLSLGSGLLNLISGGRSYNVSTAPAIFSNIGANVSVSHDLIANVSVSPVPLPASLPLMLSGLGVLGFAFRRRGEPIEVTSQIRTSS